MEGVLLEAPAGGVSTQPLHGSEEDGQRVRAKGLGGKRGKAIVACTCRMALNVARNATRDVPGLMHQKKGSVTRQYCSSCHLHCVSMRTGKKGENISGNLLLV